MDWPMHSIWWHVYPLGFCGAPIREDDRAPAHRLRDLTAQLDHALELGANGLLLGPIFASETHGYDTLDPFTIDPRLGDDEDFDELVAACRSRGIRLVLDGVFSHVAASHPDVARALADGPDSDAAALIDIDWDSPAGPAPRVFEGHDSLARLRHSSDEAAEWATSVMTHWLDRGIDGWRLDAAYSVPADFWERTLASVRRTHPDAWFLGEVIHGDYADFVGRSTVDTVTQYELWKAIWSSLHDRNMFELDWTLQRHTAFLEAFTPQTFVGNHDVTRITTTLGPDGAVTALAILLTVGGIPSLYYGDEVGLTGVKEDRLGGDDAVRPAFPSEPRKAEPWSADVLRAHQDLIGIRRRHPWLVTATTSATMLENTRYAYRATAADGTVSLDVEVDLSETPRVTIREEAGTVLWQQEPVNHA